LNSSKSALLLAKSKAPWESNIRSKIQAKEQNTISESQGASWGPCMLLKSVPSWLSFTEELREGLYWFPKTFDENTAVLCFKKQIMLLFFFLNAVKNKILVNLIQN